MSRKRILTYVLPSSLVMILLFQNCSNKNFDVLSPSSSTNLGSSTPDPDTGAGTPGGGTGGGGSPTQPTPPPTTNLPPDPSDSGRRILKVCGSGCNYTLPSQAMAAAADNDIIEVAAGSYNDCFSINRNNIKVRGVNGRAKFTGKICAGKGTINTSAKGTVLENLEFTGMANGDANGSGVRHQGLGLTVRNSYFHDGEEGILSEGSAPGSADDTILIENSRFERLGGGGGYAHAVYFGHHLQVTVRNSLFLSSRDQGHEFKSRAKNVLITCSMFASLDGVDSYTLNFPESGNVSVNDSTVQQGAATSNSTVVDYGSELGSTPTYSVNQLSFSNVTFINDRSGGNFFNVKASTQFTVSNSSIVGPGNLYGFQSATLNNTKQFPSRAAAGLTASPNLPTPSGCTNIGLTF